MGLLERLGLSQPDKWETPTIIDRVLDSPSRFIVQLLYAVYIRHYTFMVWCSRLWFTYIDPRSIPFRPLQVVCISDTHDQQVKNVPPGDLLIHAGDLTNSGSAADIQRQVDWLANQPHKYIVVVPGNHDNWFDPKARLEEDVTTGASVKFPAHVKFLQNNWVVLDFGYENQRPVKVFGMGGAPECGPALSYERNQDPWAGVVPKDTDILVSHTPPASHRDLYGRHGCWKLLREYSHVRWVMLHVFGHIHRASGNHIRPRSRITAGYETLMLPPEDQHQGSLGRVLGLCYLVILVVLQIILGTPYYMVARLVKGPLSDTRHTSTLMVNAAQQVGSTRKLRGKVEEVELHLGHILGPTGE